MDDENDSVDGKTTGADSEDDGSGSRATYASDGGSKYATEDDKG